MATELDVNTQYEVEVRVAARPEYLSAVRAVAADLAMRADFDLDSIADLKLAVDEACSTLVVLAAPDAVLSCGFRSGPDEIRVRAAVPSTEGQGPRRDTFSWRVLSTLADEVASSVTHDGAADLVGIELVKKRAAVVDG